MHPSLPRAVERFYRLLHAVVAPLGGTAYYTRLQVDWQPHWQPATLC